MRTTLGPFGPRALGALGPWPRALGLPWEGPCSPFWAPMWPRFFPKNYTKIKMSQNGSPWLRLKYSGWQNDLQAAPEPLGHLPPLKRQKNLPPDTTDTMDTMDTMDPWGPWGTHGAPWGHGDPWGPLEPKGALAPLCGRYFSPSWGVLPSFHTNSARCTCWNLSRGLLDCYLLRSLVSEFHKNIHWLLL